MSPTLKIWLSGFFAAPALVQLVRLMTGLPIKVGEWEVPLWRSAVALLIFAGLSVWFWRRR